MTTSHPKAVVCAQCGADPRTSLSCTACGGAGIGIPSIDGFLVWGERVDDFSITFRKIRQRVNVVCNLALLVAVGACISYFVWNVFHLEDTRILSQFEFWISGTYRFVDMLWVGLLILCFSLFRIIEFSTTEKSMPQWKLTAGERVVYEKGASDRARHRFDVAPFFSTEAISVVETAYTIARDLKRTHVEPLMLFASALTSASGGLCMTRLGMSFDLVKGPLARLMSDAPSGNGPILFSKETKRVLVLAYADAVAAHRPNVTVMDIFLRVFQEQENLQLLLDQLGYPAQHIQRVGEWIAIQDKMRTDHRRFVSLAALKPDTGMDRAMTAQQTPLLDRLSEDLTRSARNGFIAPLVGREREMNSLLQAIESGRRSVVLIGDTGVGKSALIDQLARRMVEEDVPPELFDRRLVSVHISQVLAAGDPSLAAERLLTMLQEVGMSGNVILVVQGIEALVGGGNGPMDLAETFVSELDKGYFIAIATTTPHAWTQYLERRSMGAKLIKVIVPAMDVDATLQVLMMKSGFLEYEHHVFFSYAALEKATSLALRYLTDVASPESALNVIREAAVFARKARGDRSIVTAQDVAQIVHEKTQIPVEAVGQEEAAKLLNLEQQLHRRIVGQEEAVTAVAQAMRRARADVREAKRPIANFLFLGSTGVGKTELSKALAAEYFGEEKSMIRLDMSEYQDADSIVRMIGRPGDDRGGLLTEAVRRLPFSIVLLDEIEKAHPDILNLFLQVMDDGRLTDGIGRTIDFTNTVVIMTSNAGTGYIQAEVGKHTPVEQIKTNLLEQELKGTFRPEFLNRFDAVIVFKPLTLDNVIQIAWLLINGVAKRLQDKGIGFTAEDEAIERLAKAGFDPLFGARPLRRVIQDQVDNALADLLLRKQVGRRDTLILQADGTLRVQKAPSL